MRRRDLLTLGLASFAAPFPTLRAFAQGKYPTQPIRFIVPRAAGGVVDVVARLWAEQVKPQLGNIVIENQGGGGGLIGPTAVARAQPDGYTLLLGGIGPLVINPIASSHVAYDPKDFDSIAIVVATAFTVAVHPSLPVNNLSELVDYAKKNPGKLSYGSAGVGSGNHLTGEMLKSLTGIDIIHVPYRGAGLSLTDLIAGQIPMVMSNVTGQVLELHHSGKLRLLAVTSPERLVAAPDIPTAIEAGLPDMISRNFIGLFAPARMPPAFIAQIAQATRTAVADREFRQVLVASGFEPVLDSTPEKTARFVEEERVRWTPIIKSIGLKLD
jgi:tripartite-type tricarboxylate transporter receptor subunit TctC